MRTAYDRYDELILVKFLQGLTKVLGEKIWK